MNASSLRKKFLDFFKEKRHAVIPSASLIPENDPTTLFISAGMHPLVPYLLGEKHPEGNRLADVQKCIRTIDIDEVGDATHHTFFEMLGNWSLGDYFKKEAIEWSWEFLTDQKWLSLSKDRLAISVFEGNENAPFDEEAFNLWKNLGISEKRIVKLGEKDNWWGPAGQTGPCGPDTEMFYWIDDNNPAPDTFDPDDNRWVEIWNDVFMEYNKNNDGKYDPLTQKNVDTGMGLERTLAALNGLDDDYLTELFSNQVKKVEDLSGKKYGQSNEIKRSMRIIVDHIKAAVFIVGDEKGITPSNTDQGYIVRRLIRRAVRYGKKIGIEKSSWIEDLARVVIDDYKKTYPEIGKNFKFVLQNLSNEESKFKETLEKGLKKFNQLEKINGVAAFDLYQTYGFPFEMTRELAEEKGINLDEKGFQKEFEKHQKLSRTAAQGKFKSGLADHSEKTTKYHTATHLLLAALRNVLGNHVEQRGSNITEKRLRLDFSHPQKLTDEEKQKIENLVNKKIKENLPIKIEEMPLTEAKKSGALGMFESKYGDKVKVYTINGFSSEICSGPHVKNTGDLGKFKIFKESASSAGVRRIKAMLVD